MRKIGIFAVLLTSVAHVLAVTVDASKVKWDSVSATDTIEIEKKASAKYFFTNTSSDPIKIISVTASCGCTASTFTNSEVAPKEKGSVELTADAKGRSKTFAVSAIVQFEDKSYQELTFKIELDGSPTVSTKQLIWKHSTDAKFLNVTFPSSDSHGVGAISLSEKNDFDVKTSLDADKKTWKIEVKPKQENFNDAILTIESQSQSHMWQNYVLLINKKQNP